MLKKYSILYGTIIPVLLLLVARLHHLEMSQINKGTIKHEWENNYRGKPLGEKTIHGSVNASWFWSILIVV
jgi:hypothetical protein